MFMRPFWLCRMQVLDIEGLMSDKSQDVRRPAVYTTTITPSGVMKRTPVEFLRGEIEREGEIEECLEKKFDLLELDSALIGRQILLEVNNKKVDLLAVTRSGRLCIVELKRDRAERVVFMQIIDYARLVSRFLDGQVDAICAEAQPFATSLSDIYNKHFNAELPKRRKRNPLLVIVAQEFASSEIEMALYLNQEHRFDIRLISYEVKSVDGERVIEFRHQVYPEDRLRVRGPMPSQIFELRFRESSEGLWDDCRKKCVVPVADDIAKDVGELNKDEDAHLLIYLDNHGYVGSGVVQGIQSNSSEHANTGAILKMRWDVAVGFENAVFRHPDDQPESDLQKLDNEDKWALISGYLRFNAEHARRMRSHGAERRPFKKRARKPRT